MQFLVQIVVPPKVLVIIKLEFAVVNQDSPELIALYLHKLHNLMSLSNNQFML